MGKKYKFMADKVQEDIERIKYILQGYNARISSNQYVNEDLIELEDKKTFLEEQLKEHESLYLKYKENNEPYYEINSYEYYKKKFSLSYDLQHDFIYEVESIADDNDTFSQKGKHLDNIVKAYREIKEKV